MTLRRWLGLTVAAVGLLGGLVGQTRVDVERQAKGKESLMAPFQAPARVGESLPAQCEVGELFFLTTAPAGGNLYGCSPADTWSPQGSAGQGQVTVLSENQLVGVRAALNIQAGTGILQIISDDGTQTNVQTAVDTAHVLTYANYQTGRAIVCESQETSWNAHECEVVPAITNYVRGMMIHWIPGTDIESGGATISINDVGAVPVRMADGITDPEAGYFLAGKLHAMWYDGSVFRPQPTLISSDFRAEQTRAAASLVQSGSLLFCVAAETVSNAFACELESELTSYAQGMLVHLVADSDSTDGPATLQIGELNAAQLKRSDGSGDLEAGDVKAGRMALVWFDGVSFRLLSDSTEAMARGTAPTCQEGYRGKLWFSEGETGQQDGLFVCAKDASDSYGWQPLY